MSMKNIKFTGLLTRKKAVRYLIYVLFVCAFAVFVIKLNQVEKTELVVRTGQTFEKAKVVKILQDNLEENGTRVGEQKVRVRMLTGVRKGEELDITSSSGYLRRSGVNRRTTCARHLPVLKNLFRNITWRRSCLDIRRT